MDINIPSIMHKVTFHSEVDKVEEIYQSLLRTKAHLTGGYYTHPVGSLNVGGVDKTLAFLEHRLDQIKELKREILEARGVDGEELEKRERIMETYNSIMSLVESKPKFG